MWDDYRQTLCGMEKHPSQTPISGRGDGGFGNLRTEEVPLPPQLHSQRIISNFQFHLTFKWKENLNTPEQYDSDSLWVFTVFFMLLQMATPLSFD